MKLKVVIVDLAIPPRVKKWGLRLGIPVAVLLGGGAVAYASGLVTWSTGQTLQASDLNNNFTYLSGEISALQTSVSAIPGVPSGAVVAFNMSACPTGWSALASAGGRVIIGVNASGGNGLSQRTLGEILGEETHILAVTEMPSHAHVQGDPKVFTNTIECGANPGSICSFRVGSTTDGDSLGVPTTTSAGGGEAHNNMQPSLALLYCQKN